VKLAGASRGVANLIHSWIKFATPPIFRAPAESIALYKSLTITICSTQEFGPTRLVYRLLYFGIKLACAQKKLAVGELKQRGFAMPGDMFDDAKQLSPASPSDVLARANKVIKEAPG
jgi:hypothetical protein